MKKVKISPCTSLQRAYFFGRSKYSELYSGAQYYFEINIESLDFNAFSVALNKLFDRHEMLRARFLDSGEQFIDDQMRFEEPNWNDLSSKPEQDLETLLMDIRLKASSYDLANPPRRPLEVHVTKLPKNIFRVHFVLNLCIFDLGGLDIFTRELDVLYHNPNAQLPEMSYSYFDYIHDLNLKYKGDEGQAAEKFWQQKIKELSKGPELPLIRKGPYNEASDLKTHSRNLSSDEWQRILNVSKGMKVSPTTLFAFVFMRTLAIWSKSQKFTIGMLVNDRGILGEKVAHVMGQFAKTILLSVDFAKPGTMTEQIIDLQNQFRESLRHSAFDGVKVVQEMNRLGKSVGQVPVPVVFVSNLSHFESRKDAIRNYQTFSINKDKLHFNKLDTPSVYFDFQTYTLSDGRVHISWDVLDKIFPSGMIELMLEAFMKMLSLVASNCIEDLSRVDLFLTENQTQLLKHQQVVETSLSRSLLQELFHKSAGKNPNKKAIIFERRTITYKNLEIYASNLAACLREKGARVGELVGILLPKGAEQVIAAMGIVESGAAYLPIQTQFPKARIELLLNRGKVNFVVASYAIDKSLIPASVEIIYVEDFINDSLVKVDLKPLQQLSDIAYVIYTSGSTGEPKGVAIDHRGCVNTILDINQRFNIGSEDSVFAISALTFDLSVYDIFGILAAGGTIVIPDESEIFNPQKWAEIIERERVTVWNSAPALMQLLTTYLAGRPLAHSIQFKTALLSGDWVAVDLPEKIKKFSPHCSVISLGGATEASIWSIYYPTQNLDKEMPSIPYGKALTHQHVYVLDEQFYERAQFVPGKIFIAGVGLAIGYWNDEVKTNEKFVIHPRTKQRLYDTGDMGRYLPDGNIEFLGREDHQVKINGFRIELNEIELLIEKSKMVEKAIVLVSPQNPNSLVAYYKRHLKSLPHIEDQLTNFLVSQLPSYMVPKVFIEIAKWPISLSGKIDRAALPKEKLFEKQNIHDFAVMPTTPTEVSVSRIFSALLKAPQVSLHDDFYQFGGDSLSAINLLVEIEKTMGMTLPVSLISGNLSVAKIVKAFGSALGSSYSPLVSLGKKTGANLYLVHPAGGNVACYNELSEHLNASVFGFQAVGFEAGDVPLERVEDLAQFYCEKLKKHQPHGPYLLGGWSFGGMVALEMARVLQNQYIETAKVVMIDFVPPDLDLEPCQGRLWVDFIRDLAKRPVQLTSDELNQKKPGELLKWVVTYIEEELDLKLSPEKLQSIFRVYCSNIQAYKNYKLGNYDFVTYKIESEDTSQNVRNQNVNGSANSWSRWLEKQPKLGDAIAGNHYTIFEKSEIQKLAKQVNDFIANTEEDKTSLDLSY